MSKQDTQDLQELKSEPVSNDLHDLKIALQVMSHDGMKLLIPALTTIIGIGTCAGLLLWSFGELQKFSPESIANTRIEVPAAVAPVPVRQRTVAVHSQPLVKVRTKARKPATKPPHHVASRVYQDYYYWSQDNPTSGRVTRSTDACTEYSWTTKVSSNHNSFRLAN